MLDDLKEEQIVNKVGGRFKLSTLIQKRLLSLSKGAKPMVHVPGGDRLAIVVQEIIQDKIYLDVTGTVMTRNLNLDPQESFGPMIAQPVGPAAEED
ncbi:DNA-directed RNA polymerase subunit omega [Tuwongella immobilis]|uniref:DNA-directed RNA polymerase subunit omega n=1 Tax=Tuwongella immobilis TaxID=692036 RepID=A0A6C2YRA0_9BACT|nr:DNA-directed RNA polymerase subunit omega [Tuwongella immobilis]VIP04178.1 dna-directed rna polymerase subunit omega : DNA-directed RNA polymerase subunit omega OS=Singulisphaera acidiphila (strain ATCC BAA-1392 / DSM 18658 / VKM B-2454 / MOB10) GN=rpoZ PE=3 SV=1: RNA_pol_Rpb6 [Tuwongella immobilis]VTS05720.1 dna-directed rna polymerase subunit omega : DNA-directed RNA polymerase subunit omega OS=Singulisphaera acidiphila (strain ATCC BAA-1392 / DSM 18658 / VKM B-2454 / MOB10) GN=rpoZ PE=3 SV=